MEEKQMKQSKEQRYFVIKKNDNEILSFSTLKEAFCSVDNYNYDYIYVKGVKINSDL
jgi:hypothetical protein